MATDPLDPFAYAERFNPRTQPLPSQAGPVDPVTAEIRRQRDRELHFNIALSSSPDAIARATSIARQAGVPPGMVEGREDEVQRDLNARRLTDLTNRYPAIGKWAAADPRGAIAAQDDHESLGLLGRAWEAIKNFDPVMGFARAVDRFDRTDPGSMTDHAGVPIMAGVAALMGDPVARREVPSPRRFGQAIAAGLPTLGRWATGPLAWAADLAGVEQGKNGFRTADKFLADTAQEWMPKGGSWVERQILGGASNAPGTIASLGTGLAGRAAGFTAREAAVASVLFPSLQQGSDSYFTARDQGVGKGVATLYGLLDTAAEAGGEYFASKAFIKSTEAGDSILRRYIKEQVPDLLGEEGTTVAEKLTSWLFLPENKDKSLGQLAAEMPEALASTAIQTLVGGGLANATISTVEKALDLAAERHRRDVGDTLAPDVARAIAALQQRGLIDNAERAAAGSKLRSRDHEAYAELVRQQGEDAGVSHVFVPAAAIRAYQQSDSYDAFSDPFSDYENDIAEAEVHGGDVVLPVGFALGTLPGSPAWAAVKDDLRLSAGGMSAREADTFEAAMADHIAQVSDELAKHERATRDALTTQEALIAGVQQKLQDAGYTPYSARQMATLAVHSETAWAARTGGELTGAEFDDLRIRQVLPPALASARNANATDLVINAIRKGGPVTSGQGPSLLEWIARRGGIEDRGGDIAAMGGDKWHRGKVGRRKLLKAFEEAQGNMLGSSGANPNSIGNTLDAAISEGFFPDLLALREGGEKIDDRELLDAIGQELAGLPVHAQEGRADPLRAAAQELEELLEQRGVLASDLTDDELRAAIERLNEEEQGHGYDQAMSLSDTVARWQEQLAAFQQGMPSYQQLQLGTVSPPYRALGFKGVLRIHAGKLRKIIEKHELLPDETIENLPALLADPAAIIPGQANEGRTLVVMSEVTRDGHPIVASIEADPKSRGDNLLITFFAMDTDGAGRITRAFNRAISDGSKVYVKKGFTGASSLQKAIEAFLVDSPMAAVSPGKAAKLVLDATAVGKSFNQPAYHGSPHIFDRFSLNAIGTGEGAQAYGWGLYFAGRKEIAEFYRDTLAGKPMPEFDGRAIDLIWSYGEKSGNQAILDSLTLEPRGVGIVSTEEVRDTLDMWGWTNLGTVLREGLAQNRTDIAAGLAKAADVFEQRAATMTHKADAAEYAAEAAIARGLAASGRFSAPSTGRLYHVDIPEDDEYLLWDKPLSEQPEMVREQLSWAWQEAVLAVQAKRAAAGIENPEAYHPEMPERAGDIYERLGQMMDSDKEASLALKTLGIVGIKYLDGGSRSAGEGSYNYVVFDDSRVSIRAYEQDRDDGPRGRILFPAGGFKAGPITIEVFQHRDLSTFLHEFGHYQLERLRWEAEQPGANDSIKRDWQAAQDWFAANGMALVDGEIPTEAHEMWARGFERYLMEGKAPSGALQKLFDTLRGWLLSVYKSVRDLGAPITPEIREVMDRLVATDEQIAEARSEQKLGQTFKDAASVGMTGPEFDAYTALVEGARGAAQSKLLQKTMDAIRRRETTAWNEAKAALTAEVRAEVDQRPVFRALDLMKTSPVSQDWIVDQFGIDALALLPRRVPPMYREGGAHPDLIAEEAGYSSGREMIEALIGAERRHRQLREAGDARTMRKRTVENEVLAEMNRRHGDPFTDGSIEREALASVNDEMQGEVLAAEVRVLGRRSGKQATPYQIARRWARQRVRRGNYAVEASPAAIQRYARAVGKAGTEAEQAMMKGDMDAAFAAKQRQMLSSALLAEAKIANEEVDAARARMDKIARRATSKSIAQDYLDQAHALLEQVDLRERTQKLLNRAGKFADWAQDRAAEGYDVVVPDSFEALLHVGTDGKLQETLNWSRLPIETLLGLDQAVAQVVHLGRLKQTLLDNQERREFDALVDEARRGADNITAPPPAGLEERGWWDSIKAGVASFDATLLKLETVFDWLDGGNPNGVFNRIVFRPIAAAQAREQDMLKDYMARIKALFEAVPAEQVQRWADKVPTSFIDPISGRPFAPVRQRLIAMALNIGNAGNLQRLADGYGWNAGAIEQLVTSELTREEWQFVQGVWDTIDTLWPEIEALEKRVNGVAPDKVEAREVVTPFGTMRGGYYPAIYDSRFDLVTEERRGRDADLFESLYTRANTRASATKAREEQVRKPILLDLGVINRHLGEVIHDMTHREAVMQAWRFLVDHRVAGLVDEKLGSEIRKQLRPWVKFVANSWATERAGNEGFGRFLSKLRANATAVGLGLRASTMVTQIAGYSNSTEVIGEARMAEGMARFAANPAAAYRFVTERSGEMRHRLETLDRDIRTEIARLTASNPASKAVATANDAKLFMFHGIGMMDMAVSIPTWIGAYNRALAEGVSEEDAAYAGDKAVRQSQGAGGPKDLAAISRDTGKYGEALKLITMFYSYFSAQYQRQRTLARDAMGIDSRRARNVPRLMARAWWLLVMPPLLVEVLKMPLGSGGPDDDEWWVQWVMRKLLANSLGPIPLARDVFEPAWNKAIKGHFFNPAISPIQRAYDSLINTAGDVGTLARGEETKQATRHTLETAGYVTGLVPGQVAAAAQFLVDVGEGDANPNSIGDWVEGLSTGRIKEDH